MAKRFKDISLLTSGPAAMSGLGFVGLPCFCSPAQLLRSAIGLGLAPKGKSCSALSVHGRLQVVQANAKEVFLQTRRKDQQRALQRLNEDAGLR